MNGYDIPRPTKFLEDGLRPDYANVWPTAEDKLTTDYASVERAVEMELVSRDNSPQEQEREPAKQEKLLYPSQTGREKRGKLEISDTRVSSSRGVPLGCKVLLVVVIVGTVALAIAALVLGAINFSGKQNWLQQQTGTLLEVAMERMCQQNTTQCKFANEIGSGEACRVSLSALNTHATCYVDYLVHQGGNASLSTRLSTRMENADSAPDITCTCFQSNSVAVYQMVECTLAIYCTAENSTITYAAVMGKT